MKMTIQGEKTVRRSSDEMAVAPLVGMANWYRSEMMRSAQKRHPTSAAKRQKSKLITKVGTATTVAAKRVAFFMDGITPAVIRCRGRRLHTAE
jgi:hypothetical protein